jgi:hypothetical protein
MNRILSGLAAGFALVAAPLALAAEATDTVKTIDATARTVTLNDNKVYVFPATIDVTKLKVGDKVKITFTTDAGGKNNVTAVAGA